VQATNTRPRFEPTADAHGICSHAGVVLLAELADRLGLTSELGRRANCGLARPGGGHAYDRGAVLRDLVVMLADGGDCVSDLAGLRDQAGLFGRVCSTATAWRIVHEIAADPKGVAALWSAMARARQRAWAAGAWPVGPLRIDVDATLLEAHSDKQGAAGTFKHGFGFHPLGAWLDRGDGTGEALAGILRPGNAGSNTAADHIGVLAMALLALPKQARAQPILVRADTAGATHAFVDDIVGRKLTFSIGFPIEPDVKAAILTIPAPTGDGDDGGWVPALDQHGRRRRGAWVAELTSLDLAGQGWPVGTRAICRRERPHPGAAHKLGFTDHTGHRFQVFITNQPDPDPATLDARHHTRPPRPTPPAATASSPTAAPPLRWSRATAPTPVWRTASAAPRPLACAICPSTTSTPTTSGSPWSWSPRLWWPGRRRCCWTASWPTPSPRPCAIGCGTPPPGWCATPAGTCYASTATGPGRTRWWRRSGGCRPPADPAVLACSHPPACRAAVGLLPPRRRARAYVHRRPGAADLAVRLCRARRAGQGNGSRQAS
jgi:DDE family transposase